MMTERTSGQDFGNKTAGPLDDKSVILRKLTFKTGTVGTVGTAICMTYSCTINYMCGGAEGMIMTMFEYYSTNIRFYTVPKLEFFEYVLTHFDVRICVSVSSTECTIRINLLQLYVVVCIDI